MSKIPERFIWAAEMLEISPGHHILEIGCGAGLLAQEICRRLVSGRYTAIERSPAMLKLAEKRNHEFIQTGRAEFLNGEFKSHKLVESSYDIIMGFNVNFFWKDAEAEFGLIRDALKAKGKLFIFYQGPSEISLEAAAPIEAMLQKYQFAITHKELKSFEPTSAFCITAMPNRK